jgi:hypothetical protein
VATDCNIHDSYIGVELMGNGADSVISCDFTNNALYAIRFEDGTVADYTSGNEVVNTAATSINQGFRVHKQSLVSEGDTIYGGYNWDFTTATYGRDTVRFEISDLLIKGKSGDDWGLVLNGPSSSFDSAFVDGVRVDSLFQQAHAYLRYIHVEIEDSRFASTGKSATASPYGIKDMGYTTGFVRCTEAFDVKTACVYRSSSSPYIDYGDATSSDGENSFYVTNTDSLPSTKYFRAYGYTTAKAEGNWWGTSPPDADRIAGPVDYTPYLTSAPECGSGEPLAKVAAAGEMLPSGFALLQNYPNPFNPVTTISFALPVDQTVRLDIFNILGHRVRTFDLGIMPAGYRSVRWDGTTNAGRPVGSGLYLYRLSTSEFTDTKKMLLLK